MTRHEVRKEVKNVLELTTEAQNELKKIEILNTNQHGHIILDENEKTTNLTQQIIKSHIDIANKEKAFDLKLNKDKYYVKYDQTGRFTLLNSCSGSLSMFDTKTKNLHFEINVGEHINDATFLHNELFVAASQKKNVYIYDNSGREIHCIRKLKGVKEMTYLDYHFLLVNSSYEGMLSYLDTSIGKIVSKIDTNVKPSCLQKNPDNAIIFLGGEDGVISLFSPNQQEFLIKVMCHRSKVRNIQIDRHGNNMITSGDDNEIKIWDLRNNMEPINIIQTKRNFECMHLSQMNLLALGYKNRVEIWKDLSKAKSANEALYFKDKLSGTIINNLQFCPFEDILCIGHDNGLSNFIIPGSGDPTFDSNEYSPFRTKKQRQRNEVARLLEKIPYQMINYNEKIGEVNNK
ncbi:WD repeat-containing protein 46 [Conglomerata obtusa]